MVSAKNAVLKAMDAQPPLEDKRRARGAASRRKIIEAMVELIADGDPDPTAAVVAAKAGVGIRSVFRNFDDKEALLREIDRLIVEAYSPIIYAPFKAPEWKDQLNELIDRRSKVNEAIVVFRVSSLTQRYKSPFVAKNLKRLHEREKHHLDEVLPTALQTSTRFGRMIMLAVSFDTWRLLREDERLSKAATVAAIKETVADIIKLAGV